MTKPEQLEFIEDLLANIKAGIIRDLPRVPDTWDGHELRMWVAERVDRGANMGTLKGRRLHEYTNTVLVENL